MTARRLPLLAGGILFWISSQSSATISEIQYSGYSAVNTVGTSTTIYGGIAGDSTDCAAGSSSTDVCNNCTQTSGTIEACNPRRIQYTTLFKVSFKSTTDGYPVMYKSGTGGAALHQTTSYVSANQTAEISVQWSNICNLLPTSGGSTTCASEVTGTAVDFGISKGNNSTIDDKQSITIQISGASLCPTNSDSEDQTLPDTTACTQATSGIYAFTAKAGDTKVYMKDLAKVTSSTFPTSSNGIQYSKIRYYYGKASTCTAGIASVRNSSNYVETNFSLSRLASISARGPILSLDPHLRLDPQEGQSPPLSSETSTPIFGQEPEPGADAFSNTGDRASFTPSNDKFTGLENGQSYLFKIALVDQAGNVGMFTPDTHCGNASDVAPYSTNVATYGEHVATPNEVVGLLTERANCFVATAAYGSSLDQHVDTLRKFRDLHLLNKSWGQSLVAFYYRHSPRLADWIALRPWARSLTRAALWPAVSFATLTLKLGPAQASLILVTFLMMPLLLIRLWSASSKLGGQSKLQPNSNPADYRKGQR